MIIGEKFLLKNETAFKLYQSFAKDMPIIDYHCHISPEQIYQNAHFENLTQIWLYGDHYKWRQMRLFGIDEKYITGGAGDYEKLYQFAAILPKLIGNPLYHWCHLELKRYFDIDLELNCENLPEIWEITCQKLKTLGVRDIIKKSNVYAICTTDDPVDSLEYHSLIKNDSSFDVKVLPAFRPDKAINIDKDGFFSYIERLSLCTGIKINCLSALEKALLSRLDYFCKMGCVAADCGIEYIPFEKADYSKVDKIFKNAISGKKPSLQESDIFKTHILLFLSRNYAKRNIVSELHYGVERNVNSNMFDLLGADTGYDTVLSDSVSRLAELFNELDKREELPKTIVYSINPNDNLMINTVCGAFSERSVKGKLQQGSAWWFNDTKEGMEAQLKAMASVYGIDCFIGMLTDSRSFLSYTRHEYFRRILCNYFGCLIEEGEYPLNASIGDIIKNICFENAKKYFCLGENK
ncbi:MAG: glucuronate isomerase [Ruminococcaceae bacterium]|nr:glucuronate isomerase [Oscillospiraceae bacterium]